MNGKTVLMKPVSETCNCRCDYCYNFESPSRQHRTTSVMDLDTVERVIVGLIQSGAELVTTTWHGGEPMLRGLQFYKDVVALQAQIRQRFPNVRIKNGMQSNLTLLDEEWCAFFKANRILLGASLDGWRELHDAHRKYSDGRGQFDDTMRGVELARKYGILGGFIAVVNDQTVQQDPRRYFDFLMSTNPKAEISPCWETGMEASRPGYIVSNEGFLAFATTLFDVWWENNNPEQSIRLFHGILQALLGGQEYTCMFKGNCGDFVGVDASGDVYPCGKFAGLADLLMGNVNETPVAQILESPIYKGFVAMRKDLPRQCQGCKWVQVCNNGCTYERYLGGQRFAEVSPHCEVWNGLYTHADGRLKTLQAALANQIQYAQ